MDFFELLQLMEAELSRIGWTLDDLKCHVWNRYKKKTRYLLTDEQLWELYEFLRSRSTKSRFTLPKIGLKSWKKS